MRRNDVCAHVYKTQKADEQRENEQNKKSEFLKKKKKKAFFFRSFTQSFSITFFLLMAEDFNNAAELPASSLEIEDIVGVSKPSPESILFIVLVRYCQSRNAFA